MGLCEILFIRNRAALLSLGASWKQKSYESLVRRGLAGNILAAQTKEVEESPGRAIPDLCNRALLFSAKMQILPLNNVRPFTGKFKVSKAEIGGGQHSLLLTWVLQHCKYLYGLHISGP